MMEGAPDCQVATPHLRCVCRVETPHPWPFMTPAYARSGGGSPARGPSTGRILSSCCRLDTSPTSAAHAIRNPPAAQPERTATLTTSMIWTNGRCGPRASRFHPLPQRCESGIAPEPVMRLGSADRQPVVHAVASHRPGRAGRTVWRDRTLQKQPPRTASASLAPGVRVRDPPHHWRIGGHP